MPKPATASVKPYSKLSRPARKPSRQRKNGECARTADRNFDFPRVYQQKPLIQGFWKREAKWRPGRPETVRDDGRQTGTAVPHGDSNWAMIERTVKPDPRPAVLRFRPALHHLQSRINEESERRPSIHSTRAGGEAESAHHDKGPQDPGIQPAPRNERSPDAAG